MSGLKKSIQKTLDYAGYFNYPLDQNELCLWLISDKNVPNEKISAIHRQQLSPDEIALKKHLNQVSLDKIKTAQKLSKYLSFIPSIDLVAVSGSVAVANAKELDDIDLLIVTKDHTLWLTRPFVLLISGLVGERRQPTDSYLEAANTFCLNLWLEKRSLKIPQSKQNLYTAHEVLQILPIYDRHSTYQQFLNINAWVKKHLANAYNIKSSSAPLDSEGNSPFSLLISPLNLVFYLLQYLYMKPKLTKETVSYHSAYFHKIDFFKKIDHHLRVNRVGYN